MKSEVKALTREQREELRRLHESIRNDDGYGLAFTAMAYMRLPALLADIDALEQRLEAAERDTARLDWLIANPDVYFYASTKEKRITLCTNDHDYMQDPEVATGETHRAAIDAAQAEEKQE